MNHVPLLVRSSLATLLASLAVAPMSGQQPAADWSQLGGPTRDFQVQSAPLASSWPEDGPPTLWTRPLGEGYSSIVVDGDLLVTMYREDDDEVIVGLDAGSGTTRWRHAYPAPLAHNGYVDVWLNAAGPGPYSTPLLAFDGVFALGVDGALHALEAETGRVRWAINLVERFELAEYNAFASSPLAFGDTVIVPLGGSPHGVVALDPATGADVWRSEAFPVAPGSPVLIRVEGQEQLVVVGQQELVGLDPLDGRLLWRHPHENELGLNVSMPVWGRDTRLFMSSAYGGGSRMLTLSLIDGRTTPEEIWSTNRMRVHFSNALRVGGLVLGSSGDFGPAFLTALDAETGEERWRDRSFARAHLLYADGKVIIADEDGELALASVTDAGLEVHARHAVLTENAWTAPTLVGRTLYVRDRRDIRALDLGR